MPQDPRPPMLVPSPQSLPAPTQTERYVLHGWILAISVALLWLLLS